MATTDITMSEFEDTVTQDGIVLVDFWASWCGPCRSFAPIFEESSENHSDAAFVKVDTEAEQELAQTLSIQSIPTLMVFRDGIQVFSQPGAMPSASLEQLITQVEELDMDAVRKEIDEHDAAHDHEHGEACNHDH